MEHRLFDIRFGIIRIRIRIILTIILNRYQLLGGRYLCNKRTILRRIIGITSKGSDIILETEDALHHVK
jgi:hypothetical protein